MKYKNKRWRRRIARERERERERAERSGERILREQEDNTRTKKKDEMEGKRLDAAREESAKMTRWRRTEDRGLNANSSKKYTLHAHTHTHTHTNTHYIHFIWAHDLTYAETSLVYGRRSLKKERMSSEYARHEHAWPMEATTYYSQEEATNEMTKRRHSTAQHSITKNASQKTMASRCLKSTHSKL